MVKHEGPELPLDAFKPKPEVWDATTDRIRGRRANDYIVDDYHEIDPEVFKAVVEGFKRADLRD